APERSAAAGRPGHEIGNHSYSHPALYLRSRRFIHDELSAAQAAIAEATGATPTLFRAPFGARWFGLREAQRELNLLGVMWTVLGLDWKLGADQIADRIVSRTENGAIICLHDGRGVRANPDIAPTLAAVDRIIPVLPSGAFIFE